MLVYLRKGETFEQVGVGFGVSTSTAWRYVNETVELLAARAPKLDRALRSAKNAGHTFVVLDGTVIPIDRVAADRPFSSGKHKMHCMNLQVIAAPDGEILWTSGALPGSVHDLNAARIWGVLRALAKSGTSLPCMAAFLWGLDIERFRASLPSAQLCCRTSFLELWFARRA